MDGEGQAWILANEILKQISRFSIVFAWFLNRISNGFSSIAKAERGFFANAMRIEISRFSAVSWIGFHPLRGPSVHFLASIPDPKFVSFRSSFGWLFIDCEGRGFI